MGESEEPNQMPADISRKTSYCFQWIWALVSKMATNGSKISDVWGIYLCMKCRRAAYNCTLWRRKRKEAERGRSEHSEYSTGWENKARRATSVFEKFWLCLVSFSRKIKTAGNWKFLAKTYWKPDNFQMTLENSKYSILGETEDETTEKRTNYVNQLFKSKDWKGTKLLKQKTHDFDYWLQGRIVSVCYEISLSYLWAWLNLSYLWPVPDPA